MKKLLSLLADRYSFIFNDGFAITDSRGKSESGNALILLESPEVKLEFLRERGLHFLFLSPKAFSPETWFSFSDIRLLLKEYEEGKDIQQWSARDITDKRGLVDGDGALMRDNWKLINQILIEGHDNQLFPHLLEIRRHRG